MTMDLAGRRATQIAKWGVAIALAIVVAGCGFLIWLVMIAAVYNRRLQMPEAFLLVPGLMAVAGLLWLRAFLGDVLQGRVFTALNAARLYRIAWLLIVAALAKLVLSLTASRAVVVLLLGLLQPTLLAGLLILVLASAWRYGSELQQDRDFTV